MAYTESYKQFVEDQMSELNGVNSRKMFGGVAYYLEGKIFAAIMDDSFRIKVGDHNRADFEKYGMEPWSIPGKKGSMPYYQVPEEILNDKITLRNWCLKAADY